jgi:hypothetical protein
MEAPQYKFSEFIDAILVKLYELDRASTDEFVKLDEVIKQIKGSIPPNWVFDAAKVLQSRGFINAIINSMGVFANLTGEGRLYVEEERGAVKKIEAAPSNYYITAGDNAQIVAGGQQGQVTQTTTITDQNSALREIVNAIESKIQNDTLLNDQERTEALGYVKVVRNELTKSEPNRNVLAAILEPLSQIISVASQVTNLFKMLNLF